MLTLERKWDRRVQQWHSHVTSAVAFEQLLKDMLKIAAPRPADACVDLGAGTGFVTMALAPLTSSVLAVDISGAMASALPARAKQDGLGNVSTQVGDLRTFDLRPSSTTSGSPATRCTTWSTPKAGPGRRVREWLRPGGSLVIGDMMFGRGASQRDRHTPGQRWWREPPRGGAAGGGFEERGDATALRRQEYPAMRGSGRRRGTRGPPT